MGPVKGVLARLDAWTEDRLARARGWNTMPRHRRSRWALLSILESAAVWVGLGFLLGSWPLSLIGWLATSVFFSGIVLNPSATFRIAWRVLLAAAILGMLAYLGFVVALVVN
jgi:hypothetical protein